MTVGLIAARGAEFNSHTFVKVQGEKGFNLNTFTELITGNSRAIAKDRGTESMAIQPSISAFRK